LTPCAQHTWSYSLAELKKGFAQGKICIGGTTKKIFQLEKLDKIDLWPSYHQRKTSHQKTSFPGVKIMKGDFIPIKKKNGLLKA